MASDCTSDNGFVLAGTSKDGNTYYIKNSNSIAQDNSVNIISPCANLGVKNSDGSAANRTFMGTASTSCAADKSTCIFSGTAAIAYGTLAQGKFTALQNLTSPVSCSNATFGDPAPCFGQACYILTY